MRTSIPGYPRIGMRRELKKATEAYFEGAIASDLLEKAAREIRRDSWKAQARAGIDHIPSNDFSLYDNMTDAAMLFGLIPREYAEAGLSPPDTMLAMTRGLQLRDGRDLKALPMRKWFNTNYHYIVPRLDADVISFEASRSRYEILDAPARKRGGTAYGTAMRFPRPFPCPPPSTLMPRISTPSCIRRKGK